MMSIYEDDDLVSALGYSRVLDRGTNGVRWVKPRRKANESLGLGLANRRSEPVERHALRERLPQSLKTGRAKKLLPHEVLVIVESRFSLSHLAKAFGVTRAAIAYYRRTARRGGPSAIESVRAAMRDEVQMRLAGVTP
jgi:hypothetical protein